jgi:predicted Zn-dependent protease
VVLSPRAAAALVSALVHRAIGDGPQEDEQGDEQGNEYGAGGRRTESPRAGSPGSISIHDDPTMHGAPGTVPFDGVGRPAHRFPIIESGRIVEFPLAGRGNIVRLSFRDLPSWGLTNLRVSAADDLHLAPKDDIHLRVSAAQFVPGSRCLARILRGEWYRGGSPAGSADGLVWEGPIETLLASVAGAGSDARFFFVGLPVETPSLRLEGISPWIVAGTGAHAMAGRPFALAPPPSGKAEARRSN